MLTWKLSRLLDTWRGCEQIDAKRDPLPNSALSGRIQKQLRQYARFDTAILVFRVRRHQNMDSDSSDRRWLEWFVSYSIWFWIRRFRLAPPEDMSRYALDVLGSAMLGQGFGAIDGKFDDTYRRVWHGLTICEVDSFKMLQTCAKGWRSPPPSHCILFAYFFTELWSILISSCDIWFCTAGITRSWWQRCWTPSTWPSQSWRDSLSREICGSGKPSTTCTKCWKVLRSNVVYTNTLGYCIVCQHAHCAVMCYMLS